MGFVWSGVGGRRICSVCGVGRVFVFCGDGF